MSFNRWIIPSLKHEDARCDGHVRARQLEEDLKEALDLLEKIKNSIPQTPASETKQLIDNFLTQFKKP